MVSASGGGGAESAAAQRRNTPMNDVAGPPLRGSFDCVAPGHGWTPHIDWPVPSTDHRYHVVILVGEHAQWQELPDWTGGTRLDLPLVDAGTIIQVWVTEDLAGGKRAQAATSIAAPDSAC